MFLLGGDYESNREPMSSKARAAVFFLISVALLVIYGIQQNKFTTTIGMWIVVTIVGVIVAYSKSTEFIADVIIILMGMSAGMVLSNTTINLV